jgi:hypothetical protein
MNEIIVCISNEVTGGNLTLVKYNVIKEDVIQNSLII